jgi:hypothetical protein
MQSFFAGMLPFQIILAVMGVLVLLVLLFILVWNVVKQRAITTFLPFFIIPVIMVGYPSIKSVQFFDAILNMNEQTNVVNNNVQDSTARASLETKVAALKSDTRSQSSAKALASIARAQVALGEYDSAAIYVQQAERLMPGSAETAEIRNALQAREDEHRSFSLSIDRLGSLLDRLKRSNGDSATLHAISTQLTNVKIPTYVQADKMRVLARSYAVIGQQNNSLKAMDKVATDTKISSADHALLDSIRSHTLQDAYLAKREKMLINTRPAQTPVLRLDQTVIKAR